MKRIFVLSLITISMVLASACVLMKSEEDNMVRFESGKYFNKNWSETAGTYEKAIIPNEKTALEIAKVIFNGIEKSKDAQEYEPQSVFYDEQDEIWIVSFGKDSNENTLGGDCSIAMQKSDGKVMRIWFGE